MPVNRRYSRFRRRKSAGFVLLEVIVSLVILGTSIAILMRSFTLSMNAIRRNDIVTQACVLAEAMMQDFELNPPETRSSKGNFEDLGLPRYYWSVEVKDEPIRYRGVRTRIDDMRELQLVRLVITYDDGQIRRFSPIDTEFYVAPIERFSYRSKFLNELFLEEGRRR